VTDVSPVPLHQVSAADLRATFAGRLVRVEPLAAEH
jgi:hypothetical protein